MGPVIERMKKEAGITSALEEYSEKPHRKRRRRRRHRSDAAGPDRSITEKSHAPNENLGNDDKHDGIEIDLESGLGHVNGSVH